MYLLFYPSNTYLNQFFNNNFDLTFLSLIKNYIDIPKVILNHLLDGLWAYALTATLIIMLRPAFQATTLAFLAFSFCTFYEYSQYQSWIGGVFDIWDILIMGIFILIAMKNLTTKTSSI